MAENTATINAPDSNFTEKVNKSIDYNHPAEKQFRAAEEVRAGAAAGEVEYDRREILEGDASYVVEDREDGPYVTARTQENEIKEYKDGLKLDSVPEDAVDTDMMDRVAEVGKASLEVGEGAIQLVAADAIGEDAELAAMRDSGLGELLRTEGRERALAVHADFLGSNHFDLAVGPEAADFGGGDEPAEVAVDDVCDVVVDGEAVDLRDLDDDIEGRRCLAFEDGLLGAAALGLFI